MCCVTHCLISCIFRVEEYEDDEHDVLHKSVAGAASGPDSPMRITVQFPRLSNHNWLVQQKEKHPDQSKAFKVGVKRHL